MPRGVRNPANVKRHYFLVAGTVEYMEVGDPTPKTMRVNGVHASSAASLNAKSMGDIQVMLQMHFHTKYSKSHPRAPEITDVVIETLVLLGSFTEAEFLKNAPGVEPEESKKEPKAPASAKERLEAEVKADMAAQAAVPVPMAPPVEETKVEPAQVIPLPVAQQEAIPQVTPEPVKAPLIEMPAETPAPAAVEAPKAS